MALTLPADNLTRSVNCEVRAETEGDGLTLEGYGAVFNSPTRIDSWEGLFDETIAPGAFAKTIAERTPVVQFDHGHHPAIGSIPIASIEDLREDRHGLLLRARLHDNDLVKPVRDAIASGAINGMSFRFRVIKEELDESGDVPLRTIREVALFELGPVVFPAYADTTVGVRGLPGVTDEQLRAAIANVLATPTLGADITDQEPLAHSGLTSDARSRALALLTLKEG